MVQLEKKILLSCFCYNSLYKKGHLSSIFFFFRLNHGWKEAEEEGGYRKSVETMSHSYFFNSFQQWVLN